MNFFAHASLAAERSSSAAFVLGAMLPDLCGFAGARLAAPPGAALGAGVRFHHASDAAFHAAGAFTAFCAEFAGALQASGVRRGPARGAAHVAGELLLDGWLAREKGVPALYRSALASASELLERGAPQEASGAAVAGVCARLHAAPVPEAYGDPAFVCARIERALAARPYLALASSETPIVAGALARATRGTRDWAPSALATVARACRHEFPTHGGVPLPAIREAPPGASSEETR